MPIRNSREPQHKRARREVEREEVANCENGGKAFLFEGAVRRGHLFAMLIHAAHRFSSTVIVRFDCSGMRLMGDGVPSALPFEIRFVRNAWLFYRSTYLLRTKEACTVRFCVQRLHWLLEYSAMTAGDCLRLWITKDGSQLGLATDGMHAAIPCSLVYGESHRFHATDCTLRSDDELQVDCADLRRMLRQVAVGGEDTFVSLHQYDGDVYLDLRSEITQMNDPAGYVAAHTVVTNVYDDVSEALLCLQSVLNAKPLRVALEIVWEDCEAHISLVSDLPLRMTFVWYQYAELTYYGKNAEAVH